MAEDDEWRPGSFTKNFSWGPTDRGLRELHNVIRVGFDYRLEDTPRELFRARVQQIQRSDYIPLNFFLYNKVKQGSDFVIVDELVFQALNFRHSANFDKLALFAFNLSLVGTWKRALPYQRRPSLWAYHYIVDRFGPELGWSGLRVSANDIERFVQNDTRYRAQTARKLATNLAYLYRQGRLSEYNSKKAERWWISSLFLILDRVCEEILLGGAVPQEDRFEEYAIKNGFHSLSGPRSIAKDLAFVHFTKLYAACGGRSRFSDEATLERQKILLPQIQHFANNPEPIGVFHSSDPNARGAIPRACAMLAQYIAGFEWIPLDELEDFDVDTYVRQRTHAALEFLRRNDISPDLSVEEVLQLTRGE